ncbi:Pnec [Acrasis kona]|uniref:Pnec n=1 Tax=Acrasis kona TaxID=1008807 RepID=A0AAW2YSD0_9EUKA
MSNKGFKSMDEFYPHYISEHKNPINRILHVMGTTLAVSFLLFCLTTGRFALIPFIFVIGYGFAWVGHFVFEKNKPATFKHPFYSFAGDFYMLYDIITRKRSVYEFTRR